MVWHYRSVDNWLTVLLTIEFKVAYSGPKGIYMHGKNAFKYMLFDGLLRTKRYEGPAYDMGAAIRADLMTLGFQGCWS